MEELNLKLEEIENKIVNSMNGSKSIEIMDLENILDEYEIVYMVANMYDFKLISFCEITKKRLIEFKGKKNTYFLPYMKIYRIGI